MTVHGEVWYVVENRRTGVISLINHSPRQEDRMIDVADTRAKAIVAMEDEFVLRAKRRGRRNWIVTALLVLLLFAVLYLPDP